MSVLATVSIIECDDCKKKVKLETDEEWANYERDWSDSLVHNFCPNCKNKLENLAATEADNSFLQSLGIKTAEERERWADVIQ